METTMTENNPQSSPDEQVYQSNKREPAVREVYSNENDEPAVEPSQEPDRRADQDEAVAESFPASDPPATTSSVPKSRQSDI